MITANLLHTDARSYDRFMGRWSRLVAPQMVEFAGVPASGRILDIGSGTGSLAFWIAQNNNRTRVVGIEHSRAYAEFSKSANPFPDRVEVRTGDAQELKLPDAAFDATLSLLVFNFIPDPAKALRELRRVTKPGGRISAAIWDYGEGMRMLRAFWDAAVSVDSRAEERDERHMPLCRAGELEKLWISGGLRDVREQPLTITMRFENFADYWEPFLLGQGPAGAYVRGVDPHCREALRHEVRTQLQITSDDSPFDLPARAWAVRGTVPRQG